MNGPMYPLPVLADFSRESYAHGVADERARIRQAVEAAWEAGFAPVMNFGLRGDPKPYPLEGHCYECNGEKYGADAAMDVVLAIIDGEQA